MSTTGARAMPAAEPENDRVAEREDAAVGGDEPVAGARRRRRPCRTHRAAAARSTRSSRGSARRRTRRSRRPTPPTNSRRPSASPPSRRSAGSTRTPPVEPKNARVAEREDPAVRRHQPVAVARSASPPSRRSAGSARTPPVEPKNRASPNAKIPPSDATNQYPLPVGVGAMPTIGAVQAQPARRTEEARVAEGEDAAVGRDQPVAVARRRRRELDDRLVQAGTAGRAEEPGAAEREDAAAAVDSPVAAQRSTRASRTLVPHEPRRLVTDRGDAAATRA